MPTINDNLDLLGRHVEDRITQFSGVVTSVAFDVCGCTQALVTPAVLADGKRPESVWYDVERIRPLPDQPAMEPPPVFLFNVPPK